MGKDGQPTQLIGSFTFAELGKALAVDVHAPQWILGEADKVKKTTYLRFFENGINGVKKNELTYVQELAAKRNKFTDKLRLEVNLRKTDGVTKDLRNKMDVLSFEVSLVEAEMAGAQHGLKSKKNSDYRAVGIINQLLKGDEWRRSDHKDEFHLTEDPGKPMNELIVGSVILLWTEVNGQKLIYVQKERHDKPQFDKQPGDLSFVAGLRNKGETIKQGADRELHEETKLRLSDIALNPMPIGYFQFPPNKDNGEVEGPWIVAFSAYLQTKQSNHLEHRLPTDEEIVAMNEVGPRDGETFNPGWKTLPVFMESRPVRGAMVGIAEAWAAGKTRIIQPTSPGRR